MHAIDRRIGLLFGAFVLLLGIASARAAYLGVFHSSALSSFANSQAVVTTVTPALRGEITDRTGQVLAISEQADEIIADPQIMKDPRLDADKLAPLVGENANRLLAAITRNPAAGYVVLATGVPSSNATKIMALRINGINDHASVKRVEPLGATAAQVLGWVNAKGVGAAGVEYVLNNELKGHSGVTRVIQDGNQQAIAVDTTKAMAPGDNVSLTLSVPLQQETERALAEMVATYGGTKATAIVTDPQTGQILADANWPAVNPNDIRPSQIGDIGDQSVQLSYEPGSTFKAITVAGGLQDGTITPSTIINEPPYLDPYGTEISDAEPHGYVSYSVATVLKLSSNIGADMIAQRDTNPHDGLFPGSVRFNYWVHRFGFGTPTGVALNGESQGVVPALADYSGISMYNLPFGQGEEVTPMQMTQAYDAIADGGILRTPQIVDAINGRKVAEPRGHRIISAAVASELRVMLRGVFADGGTASGAQIPGYDLAGKTGTAQVVVGGKYSDNLYNASFIGMVPARDPKLLVTVVDANVPGGYGGTVAGSAFQKIIGWAVPHFGIDPCDGTCPASAYASPTASTP